MAFRCPGTMWPGHTAKAGTRIPPSYRSRFFPSQCRCAARRAKFGAVVATKENQGVVVRAVVFEAVDQAADLVVHGGDAAVIVAFFQRHVPIEGGVRFFGYAGQVGGVVPDDAQKRNGVGRGLSDKS